jgi:hypothetical protein
MRFWVVVVEDTPPTATPEGCFNAVVVDAGVSPTQLNSRRPFCTAPRACFDLRKRFYTLSSGIFLDFSDLKRNAE